MMKKLVPVFVLLAHTVFAQPKGGEDVAVLRASQVVTITKRLLKEPNNSELA